MAGEGPQLEQVYEVLLRAELERDVHGFIVLGEDGELLFTAGDLQVHGLSRELHELAGRHGLERIVAYTSGYRLLYARIRRYGVLVVTEREESLGLLLHLLEKMFSEERGPR